MRETPYMRVSHCVYHCARHRNRPNRHLERKRERERERERGRWSFTRRRQGHSTCCRLRCATAYNSARWFVDGGHASTRVPWICFGIVVATGFFGAAAALQRRHAGASPAGASIAAQAAGRAQPRLLVHKRLPRTFGQTRRE